MNEQIRLLKGDCLELMKDIPDKSIDAIIADLPYGTTSCKWDAVIPFEPLWEQYKRIIKDNGAIVLFGSQPFTSALVMSNPKWFKCQWIWNKQRAGNFQLAKYQPLKITEDICVFGNGRINYYPIPTPLCESSKNRNKYAIDGRVSLLNHMASGEYKPQYNFGKEHGYPKNILEFKREYRPSHPTQKPVALIEYLIKTYTNEGELVLDNAMGSGTTGIACLNTNRRFIGIEKDDKYFDIAYNRIKNHINNENIPLRKSEIYRFDKIS